MFVIAKKSKDLPVEYLVSHIKGTWSPYLPQALGLKSEALADKIVSLIGNELPLDDEETEIYTSRRH